MLMAGGEKFRRCSDTSPGSVHVRWVVFRAAEFGIFALLCCFDFYMRRLGTNMLPVLCG